MIKKLFPNLIFQTIKSINVILTSPEKRKIILASFLILVNGIIDIGGLALFLPLIAMAMDYSIIHNNDILRYCFTLFHYQSERNFVLSLAFFIFSVFVFKNLFSVFSFYYQSKIYFGVSKRLSLAKFVDFYNADFLNYININPASAMRNISTVTNLFATAIMQPMTILVSELMVLLLVITGIIIYNPGIFAILLIVLAPTFTVLYYSIRKKMVSIGIELDRLSVKSWRHILHGVGGYIDVKLTHKENYFIRNYADSFDKINHYRIMQFITNNSVSRVIEVVAILGIVLIFAYALFSPEHTSMLTTTLPVFGIAAYRVMPIINRMLLALVSIKSYQYVLNLLKDELDPRENKPKYAVQNTRQMSFDRDIIFRNIIFRYPAVNKNVLNKISFEVKKGETVGFVGRSGSGKTTLINIFLQFLKPQEGEILVDGLMLTEDYSAAWRKLIGYVKQDIYIMDETLAENIAFGELPEDINAEKLQTSIRMANLTEFVDSLPDGVRTKLGDRGAKISGGQRQRIGIARALYKDCSLLVFDEATSSLDTKTENEITDSIRSLSQQKFTIFIIAHRITTLQHCDRIYEIDNGKISGVYKYDELLARELGHSVVTK